MKPEAERKRALGALDRDALEGIVLRLQDQIQAARAEVVMAHEDRGGSGRSFFGSALGADLAKTALDQQGKAVAAALRGALPESTRFALVLEDEASHLAVFANGNGPTARSLLGRGLHAIADTIAANLDAKERV